MSYEKAWLNNEVKCHIPDIDGIGGYLVDSCSQSMKDGRIIDTAVEELKKASKELFGKEPGQISIGTYREGYKPAARELFVKIECAGSRSDKADSRSDKACDGKSNECREDSTTYGENCGQQTLCVDEEAFSIKVCDSEITILAGGARGCLYGVFRLIFGLKSAQNIKELEFAEKPSAQFRMLNHWDNSDGSIERGYSGKSFFFRDDKFIIDDRTVEYARLISSVGVNATVINNVNVKSAASRFICQEYRADLKKLIGIFADYGIKTFLSLNYASPIEIGGLDSCDPCDERVIEWWKKTLAEFYSDVPDFGGFLIKADSEGRPGPFTYGRNHAQGANMLADIVAPYGGIIIWRCFVYNCKQDWRDTVTDRAKAQYDNFAIYDGQFKDNVILQIKNGPMDFQVREPVSPLFGALKKTNRMMEFQIAQEYTGQQRHVCYLIPEFKEILGFHTYCEDEKGSKCELDTIEDIVTGRTFHDSRCGITAVANTGDDENWTGHDLAAANLYGLGRLMFNTKLSSEDIAKEWIKLTFGSDPEVVEKITKILMMSWPAYEKYTAPLGVGWMVNPGYHYGPNVDGYEFSEWGTYHRSDKLGMGVDRTVKGTGYTQQYFEPNASMYENLETCPDELLLFFHHVPYTYRLHSGKTVIQHIYDTHYEGAQDADEMLSIWKSLEGKVNEKAFARVLERMTHQSEHSKEWRDHICGYYLEKSGIADEKHR